MSAAISVSVQPTPELRAAALDGLARAVASVPAGPARDALALMELVTHIRIGDVAAVVKLIDYPVAQRMAGLELIAANQAATPALAELARGVMWQTDPFALLSDRHLGLWAGMTPTEVGFGETNSSDRLRIIARLVAAQAIGVGAFEALLDQLQHQVDVDGAVVLWCEHNPFSAEAEGLLGRVRSAGARLEAMAAWLFHAGGESIGAARARAWCETADLALVDAPPQSRGVHLARRAALIGASGGDGVSLMREALTHLEREVDASLLARAHRAVLRAAATLGFSAWEPIVEQLGKARPYLRDLDRFLTARSEIVRTLTRVVTRTSELDRAHQDLRELGRRLPSRWLDLFHYAVVADLVVRVAERSAEVQVGQLEAWLREGMPRLSLQISVEDIVVPFRRAAPERVLGVVPHLPSAAQQAVWCAAVAV